MSLRAQQLVAGREIDGGARFYDRRSDRREVFELTQGGGNPFRSAEVAPAALGHGEHSQILLLPLEYPAGKIEVR